MGAPNIYLEEGATLNLTCLVCVPALDDLVVGVDVVDVGVDVGVDVDVDVGVTVGVDVGVEAEVEIMGVPNIFLEEGAMLNHMLGMCAS